MSNQFNDYEDFSNDVDFDTNESRGNDRDAWYKGTKGTVDRGSFVYFHRYDVNAVNVARRENPKLSPADVQEIAKKAISMRAEELGKAVADLTKVDLLDTRTVKFKKIRASYQDGLGFVVSRLGLDGSEADRVWKQLPEPKVYYVTGLIFYPTDKKGNVVRDKESFQNGWSVRPWRLSEPNYDEFDKLNKSLQAYNQTLARSDFTLECTDQTYQKFKITGAGPAIWTKSAGFSEQVLTKAMDWYEKLQPFREMTTQQLIQKLGGGSGPTAAGAIGAGGGGGGGGGALPAGGAGETNFDDILGGV